MTKRVLTMLAILLVFINFGSARAENETKTDGVDIMIVCAHPGDEYLFLGGALPTYVGEGMRRAVVVYLSGADEAQQEQAKESLSVYGDRVETVFGSFSDVYTSTEEEALRYWDIREVTGFLVSVIREYQPTIVMTHDKAGEYGHGAHFVTFDAVYQAVPYASDAGRYPESAVEFGAWQVQRMYAHLYGEDPVCLDRSVPLANMGGQTALELDTACYQTYEDGYPIKITDGAGYTCAKYGLVFPENDQSLNPASGDLFDGLDPDVLYATVKPEPTPSPTATATATETVQSTEQISATKTVLAANLQGSSLVQARAGILPIVCIVVAALSCALFVIVLILKKNQHRKLLLMITACVFAASLITYILSGQDLSNESIVPAAESAAMEANTPTPSPTAEQATPSPTPEADPWDIYFRAESDPAEVVIVDLENEHWEYRTDHLSILIDRVHTNRADGKPICYCIANIRMREEDAFRAGVRNDNPKSQPGLEQAWHMARRYRAVLGIAGDNLIHSEAQIKGILMRNGKIYSQNQAQDTLAFIPQDLTMRVYKPKTITAQELLDMGVLNTFSFGPTLLNDGVRDLKSKRESLGRENPRGGIGMVEPGHFVAITVDGRQKDYSFGMTITEFAQLFYLNGCQIAYNLDGGSTTAMIFMGECLNQHSGVGSDVQRPMTDGLFWGNSELVPTVDDPIYNDGSKPWKTPPNA